MQSRNNPNNCLTRGCGGCGLMFVQDLTRDFCLNLQLVPIYSLISKKLKKWKHLWVYKLQYITKTLGVQNLLLQQVFDLVSASFLKSYRIKLFSDVEIEGMWLCSRYRCRLTHPLTSHNMANDIQIVFGVVMPMKLELTTLECSMLNKV